MTRAALNRHRTATLDPVPDPPEPVTDPRQPLMAWLLAGCALFTVVSNRTGAHVVVKIVRTRRPHELSWSWFVWTRGGPKEPDAIEDGPTTFDKGPWHYVGEFYPRLFSDPNAREGPYIVPTQASDARAVHLIRPITWVIRKIRAGWDGTGESVPAQLLKSVRCARCRRQLTDEESIRRGLGPECWGKSMGGGE